MSLPPLNSIDAIIVGVLMVGVMVGGLRGTVREMFSLVAVVGGHYVAMGGYAAVLPGLAKAIELPQVAGAVAYILLFIACVLGIELLANMVVRTMNLGKPYHFADHLGGLALGSAKAVILVGILLSTLAVWPQGREGISKSFIAPTFFPAAKTFSAHLKKLPAKKDLLKKR